MDKIVLTKINEVDMKIACDTGILMEIKDSFNFFVDGAKYMPSYKSGMWDGYVSPLNIKTRTFPVGLYSQLKKFSEARNYVLEVEESEYGLPSDLEDVTYDEVADFVKSLEVHSGGKPLEVRDYQLSAIFSCIRHQRLISITPTGGGKSLILYCLFRWYLEKFDYPRLLMVVPNLSLIKQMFSDFKDYSSKNKFSIESNVQIIQGGTSKIVSKPITISTWQSISTQHAQKLGKSWFRQFQFVAVDEVHGAKSKELSALMNSCTDAKYRIGVTGSLDKSVTNKMVIQGIFGDVSKSVTARDLIEQGYLSEIDIKCYILKYGKETHKLMSHADYQTEILFLTQHERRNKFIRELALMQKGNSLVLFTRVETHGQIIYDMIKEKAGDRPVFFVHGGVEADEREDVRKLTEEAENAIIVASAGTFATGVNIKRLHNIIFASPTKSVIRVMQSLGRGLRKAHDKDKVVVYDIADALFVTKTKQNTTMKHFADRLSIYTQEQHPYTIKELTIE